MRLMRQGDRRRVPQVVAPVSRLRYWAASELSHLQNAANLSLCGVLMGQTSISALGDTQATHDDGLRFPLAGPNPQWASPRGVLEKRGDVPGASRGPSFPPEPLASLAYQNPQGVYPPRSICSGQQLKLRCVLGEIDQVATKRTPRGGWRDALSS